MTTSEVNRRDPSLLLRSTYYYGGCNPLAVDYEKLINQLKHSKPDNIKDLQEDIRNILYSNEEETNKIIDIVITLDPMIKIISDQFYDFP